MKKDRANGLGVLIFSGVAIAAWIDAACSGMLNGLGDLGQPVVFAVTSLLVVCCIAFLFGIIQIWFGFPGRSKGSAGDARNEEISQIPEAVGLELPVKEVERPTEDAHSKTASTPLVKYICAFGDMGYELLFACPAEMVKITGSQLDELANYLDTESRWPDLPTVEEREILPGAQLTNFHGGAMGIAEGTLYITPERKLDDREKAMVADYIKGLVPDYAIKKTSDIDASMKYICSCTGTWNDLILACPAEMVKISREKLYQLIRDLDFESQAPAGVGSTLIEEFDVEIGAPLVGGQTKADGALHVGVELEGLRQDISDYLQGSRLIWNRSEKAFEPLEGTASVDTPPAS